MTLSGDVSGCPAFFTLFCSGNGKIVEILFFIKCGITFETYGVKLISFVFFSYLQPKYIFGFSEFSTEFLLYFLKIMSYHLSEII